MIRRARVLLGDVEVGELSREPNQRIRFRFSDGYGELSPRPVLGQVFEERPWDHVWTSSVRAPRWFSQLLPEGPLRRMVSQQIAAHTEHEFDLLVRLGGDLPGAVRVLPMEEGAAHAQGQLPLPPPPIGPESAPEDGGVAPIRFSLAGVQLKWSALEGPRGLTLPGRGEAGQVLVKLPYDAHSRVPENEHAMLCWARAAGIQVADHRLAERAELPWTPEWAWHGERQALVLQRFDRQGGKRVHMEDLYQVLPDLEDKYGTNCDTLARAVLALCGEADLRSMIRRLVFCVACGNADAHAKNWSLLYPDGIRPRLSPAYDLVSTVLYPQYKDELALNLAGTRDPRRVTLGSFATLADRLGFDPDDAVHEAQQAVMRTRQAWAVHRDSLTLSPQDADTIEQRMDRLLLMQA